MIWVCDKNEKYRYCICEYIPVKKFISVLPVEEYLHIIAGITKVKELISSHRKGFTFSPKNTKHGLGIVIFCLNYALCAVYYMTNLV